MNDLMPNVNVCKMSNPASTVKDSFHKISVSKIYWNDKNKKGQENPEQEALIKNWLNKTKYKKEVFLQKRF